MLPLPFLRRPPAPPRRAPREDAEPVEVACGWFDSSHDLKQGLAVVEHAAADRIAEALPLDDWIELHLAGWSVPGRFVAR